MQDLHREQPALGHSVSSSLAFSICLHTTGVWNILEARVCSSGHHAGLTMPWSGVLSHQQKNSILSTGGSWVRILL